MSTDCGACWAKYLLCFFNFVFFIFGILLLAFGIWMAADKSSFKEATKIVESSDAVSDALLEFLQEDALRQWSYTFIACGALFFIISFLGCCGALKESRCLLTCYGVVLIVILVTELTLVGLIMGFQAKAEDKTKEIFKRTIEKYYSADDTNNGMNVFWNAMMSQLKCCGVNNYNDFDDSKFRKNGNKTVPDACCVMEKDPKDGYTKRLKDPNCPYKPTEANSYYMKGCYDAFLDLLFRNSKACIIVSVVVIVVELLGICLAFCLCKTIDRYFK